MPGAARQNINSVARLKARPDKPFREGGKPGLHRLQLRTKRGALLYVPEAAIGKFDDILPIERCSRKLVPVLKGHGLALEYQEFEGPHTIPAKIREEAVDWFLRK